MFSNEVWDSLQKKLASSMKACTMQIRVDLATSKKRDFPIAKFFCKIIGLTIDNTFLRDDEVLVYVLVGLLADYNTYFTSMMAKIEPLSLDNVFTHLIVFEAHQLQHVVELQLQHSASANYVGHRGTFRGGSHGNAPSHGNRHVNNSFLVLDLWQYWPHHHQVLVLDGQFIPK